MSPSRTPSRVSDGTAIRTRRALAVCTAATLAMAVVGCGPTKPTDPAKPNYSRGSPKDVPAFLHNSVFEQTDLQNASPQRVSGFGLVVNLDGTGDTRAPIRVREFMQKQLQIHGFGSSSANLQKLGPDQVLNDPKRRVAIVRVDGYIPPGAHAGQRFDVQVSALENSNTTSLHHGELYQTDLSVHGGDSNSPGGANINTDASVSGTIAINPSYAVAEGKPTQNQKLSMRYGLVMNGGTVADERPLVLKLRQPERRLSRQIENRINERFQDAANERGQGSKTAVAEDEGKVRLYVPKKFGNDWEHFVNVAMHLFSDPNDDFAALKAKQLADIAAKDGAAAPLMDISYCFEGLGETALPAMRPLYSSPVPDVAYAAARAGAFLGDNTAQQALARIAGTRDNPFQINAVETIAALTPNAVTKSTLRDLLNGDQLLVRIAAYEAMVRTNDGALQSTPVREKFTLDVVESDGPPVVYATRVGEPRIAILGRPSGVLPPMPLMALDNTLTVLPDAERRSVKIYYRGNDYARDVSLECVQDLKVIVARLGGLSAPGEPKFAFNYTDVVGLLQRMTDAKMVASTYGGDRTPAVFHMQSVPGADDPILSAPELPDQRPTEAPTTQTVLR